MRFALILSAVLLLIAIENLYCIDTLRIKSEALSHQEIPRNYLGVSASSISGIGISYHRISGDINNYSNAVKFSFIILPDLYDDNVWIFAGIELQNNIHTNNFSRFYWLLGIAYQSLYITGGPAVGIELFSGKPGISVNFDAGLSFLQEIPNPHASRGSYGIEIAPGIGLGISYAY